MDLAEFEENDLSLNQKPWKPVHHHNYFFLVANRVFKKDFNVP